MASGDIESLHTGEKIIIGGLVVQILFFSVFLVTSVTFHRRAIRYSTARVQQNLYIWQKHLYALYGGSTLILVRSVFRLIEYAQGNDGYIISHEVFLYIFDSVLMLATMVIFAIIHPSEVTALDGGSRGKAVKNVVHVYQMH